MLLANGQPVYGSSEVYDHIYSNLLEKRNKIGHMSDLESLLFYYNHDKLGDYLENKGQDPKKYLKLIQVEIGKNLDRIEQFSTFDNLTRLMLGIQKVSHLTTFHPIISRSLVSFARRTLTQRRKQNVHSLLNMLYVSNNLMSKYAKIKGGENTSEKIIEEIENFDKEVDTLNYDIGNELIYIKHSTGS
jgi:hypothetical protein